MFTTPVQSKPSTARKRRLLYIIISTVLIISAALISLLEFKHEPTNRPTTHSKSIVAQPVHLFLFDGTKAPAWHSGPSDATSLVAFYNKADCFVEFDQHPGTINDADENTKAIATMQSQGSLNVTTTNVPLTLSAASGVIPYTLHEYRSNGGQSNYYQYQEAAYIQQPQNYLAISGYCKNGNDLNATLDALRATSLNHV